jgi:hypothetical protein
MFCSFKRQEQQHGLGHPTHYSNRLCSPPTQQALRCIAMLEAPTVGPLRVASSLSSRKPKNTKQHTDDPFCLMHQDNFPWLQAIDLARNIHLSGIIFPAAQIGYTRIMMVFKPRYIWLLMLCLALSAVSIAINNVWGRPRYIETNHIVVKIRETRVDFDRNAAEHFLGETPHLGTRQTLVSYVFSDTDPQYRGNLEAFIQQGVLTDESADYIIIVQNENTYWAQNLPPLPVHARYVNHTNDCYDW